MKVELNKNQAGLALGVLYASMHFLWVFAVILNMANWVLEKTFVKHFVSVNYTFTEFDPGIALWGILLAFVCGFITGWVFAWLWNFFGKKLK